MTHPLLSRDIKLLGSILGQVLAEQEGPEFLELVEKVRRTSKARRRSTASEKTPSLAHLPVEKLRTLTRAFAIFLVLSNTAEQHHRIRRRKDKKKATTYAFAAELALLAKTAGNTQLNATLANLGVEFVLTAHPTEISRWTVSQKYHSIERSLAVLDGDADKTQVAEEWKNIRRQITGIWLTDEIRRLQPTPIDEARLGNVVAEQALWKSVPQALREIETHLPRGVHFPDRPDYSPFTFGTWMGGDRDGNPNVKSATTLEAHRHSKRIGTSLFLSDIRALMSELSLHKASDELMAKVGKDSREPYRDILRPLERRLEETVDFFRASLRNPNQPLSIKPASDSEVREPLLLCWRSLQEVGASSVANGHLLDSLRRLAAFGLRLYRLDIRQESSIHTQAVHEIMESLGVKGFSEKNEAERIRALIEKLRSMSPAKEMLPKNLSPESIEVLQTLQVAQQIDADDLGSYIISMCRGVSDILSVEFLKRFAGCEGRLPVVPLFETIEDLEAAPEIVKALLALQDDGAPIPKPHEFQIMLGYSDSAKSGGRLASAWNLFRAQQKLTNIAQKYDKQILFFHGRGGTIGRGGGPVRMALKAQPPGTLRGRIRITVQGEMIQAEFGLAGIALRTLETYAIGALQGSLSKQEKVKAEWMELLQNLSDDSMSFYRETANTAEFSDYFQAVTPLAELGNLKIGSRPARRKKSGSLDSLRAIPWIFAWTQNRFLVPSWLGVGTALETAMKKGHLTRLQTMYQKWAFFRTVIDLVEMVLAKADMEVAQAYESRLVPEELRPVGEKLRQEFARSVKAVLKLTGKKQLLADNETLRHSIHARNPYVDPIGLVQIELLARLRADDAHEGPEQEALLDALMLTFNGIAAGMRNTG
jgi:phosphoenolpyruvate carboxylase